MRGHWTVPAGGGGGSSTLAGLDDVNIESPTDGQALVYDAESDTFKNGDVAQPEIFNTERDGLVPKSVEETDSKYLRDDGQWAEPIEVITPEYYYSHKEELEASGLTYLVQGTIQGTTDAKTVGYNNTGSGLQSTNVQDAIDEVKGDLPFRLGIDSNGNYGYYKAGADTVTPFKAGYYNVFSYEAMYKNPPQVVDGSITWNLLSKSLSLRGYGDCYTVPWAGNVKDVVMIVPQYAKKVYAKAKFKLTETRENAQPRASMLLFSRPSFYTTSWSVLKSNYTYVNNVVGSITELTMEAPCTQASSPYLGMRLGFQSSNNIYVTFEISDIWIWFE